MEERVVTLSFEAKIDGESVDVCGANIILAVNEIPRIELMVPPSKNYDASPLSPSVSRPRISDFADLYKKLSKKAEGLKTRGTVKITLKTKSTEKDIKDEKLTLENWVLCGVGLSGASATAAPHLSVILQHPSCYLTKVGSIYEEPKSTAYSVISSASANCGSFLEIVSAVYSAMRDDVDFYQAPDDMPEEYRKNLGVNEYDPERYIAEKYNGSGKMIFWNAVTTQDAVNKIAAAIGTMVCPADDGTSTWDMIVRSSGSLFLGVVQNEKNNYTMEKGLVIEPLKPWRTDSVIRLDEDRCMMTELPGMDMMKLVGVMARPVNMFTKPLQSGFKGEKKKRNEGVCDILYAPVDPESSDGRIMKTSAPPILCQAFAEDGAKGQNISESEIAMTDLATDSFNRAIMNYCRAVYEISYGSLNTARAQMALGFRDVDGKLILPGNTFRFVSDGKDIYYGYGRKVVHTMSSNGGCSTLVEMTHVRPTKTVQTVPDGNINAVYDLG